MSSPFPSFAPCANIVKIIHHLELQTVQHSPTFEIKDEASFRTWIRKESFIRLMTMALMLDNSFGIFHNVSPRFQWAELDVPFQTDDRFFRLSNYDAMLASKLTPVRRMKIKDAFLLLFSPPETAERDLEILRNGQLNALDMQMLIHCMSLLPPFSVTPFFSCISPQTLTPQKSSTHTSGLPRFLTPSPPSPPHPSRTSSPPSRQQCTTGSFSGTKSRA